MVMINFSLLRKIDLSIDSLKRCLSKIDYNIMTG